MSDGVKIKNPAGGSKTRQDYFIFNLIPLAKIIFAEPKILALYFRY